MLRRTPALLLVFVLLLSSVSAVFAQVAFPANAVVHTATDLRTGPGPEYASIRAAVPGQDVVLLAANAKGTWYKLDKGVWIDATAVVIEGSAAVDARDGAVPEGALAATVKTITDGGTIAVVLDGARETVRYLGIDAPDRGQPGYKAATEANRQLVLGKTVYLVLEQTDRDAEGRLLRDVYLADGTFVNGQMVAAGMAQPAAYPPDVAQHDRLVQLAVAAAKAQRGFWSGTAPYDGAMSYALTTAPAPLYAAPGEENAVLLKLPADTPLVVAGRTKESGWFQVSTPAHDAGWIAAPGVAIHVPLAQVPITGKTTTPASATPSSTLPTPTPLAFAGAAIVNARANLRTGPGTDYPVAGAAAPGTTVSLTGRSADGSWLLLDSGKWIAAFLVDGAPTDLPAVGE